MKNRILVKSSSIALAASLGPPARWRLSSLMTFGSAVLAATVVATPATAQDAGAGIVRVAAADFHPDAGDITFSEYPLGTVNPTYNPSDYGGPATAPIVTFDGYFSGQSLSTNPEVDCPGAAATACIVGHPTSAIALDPASPNTFIVNDGAAPNSPVLSGSPTFNGPIAVLFSQDQAGVGFDAGYFDAAGSTGITAFARDGTLLGTVANNGLGIEFLGLVTADGSARIAGVFLNLVGAEPAGFAIDSLRFGLGGQITIPGGGGEGGGEGGGGVTPQFLYWDGDDPVKAANGVVDGGDGRWDATATNWTTVTGTPNGAYTPNPGSVTFAGAPGTVTVDDGKGNIAVTGMTFAVSGYHLVGDPITLGGTAATIKVGDATPDAADMVATIDAPLTGAGGLTKTGLGTLFLGGVNDYAGPTTVSEGTVVGSATSFGSGPATVNANLVIDQPTDATFGNAISGTGALLKTGTGTLTLTGYSDFAGATAVAQGKLLVHGTLSDSVVTVASGAILGGHGTVGGIVAQSGATVSPGASVGLLTVVGNYAQAGGSTYAAELTSSGTSDKLSITGSAALASGAKLVVTKLDAARYVLGTRYTILTAAGGVSGRYGLSGDTGVSIFYDLVAGYDPTNVYLDVAQTHSFASAAVTRNQIAAASGADSTHGTLHDAIGYLQTAGEARGAFDAISGEIHATARAAAFEDSRFVREAVYARLSEASPPRALWAHLFGSWGHMRGDGNAARYQRDIGGGFLGYDFIHAGEVTIGLLGGYGHSTLKLPARASSATADDAYLGAYLGVASGPLSFKAGGSYTFRDLRTTRSVAFTGFSDTLGGKYDLGIAQGFAEAGYKIPLGAFTLEPVASVAWVQVHSGQAFEKGGPAALDLPSKDSQAVFTNVGTRFSAGAGKLRFIGAATWRHANGNRDGLVPLAFAGGSVFTVAAPPIAKDVAALELGTEVGIAPNATFSISYSGQTGKGLEDHGARAALRWMF